MGETKYCCWIPDGGPNCWGGSIPPAPGEALAGISPPMRIATTPAPFAPSPGGIMLAPPLRLSGSLGMLLNVPLPPSRPQLFFFLLFLELREDRPSFSLLLPRPPAGKTGACIGKS